MRRRSSLPRCATWNVHRLIHDGNLLSAGWNHAGDVIVAIIKLDNKVLNLDHYKMFFDKLLLHFILILMFVSTMLILEMFKWIAWCQLILWWQNRTRRWFLTYQWSFWWHYWLCSYLLIIGDAAITACHWSLYLICEKLFSVRFPPPYDLQLLLW